MTFLTLPPLAGDPGTPTPAGPVPCDGIDPAAVLEPHTWRHPQSRSDGLPLLAFEIAEGGAA